MKPKLIAAGVVGVLALIIIIQNFTPTEISFLFISVRMPVAILCAVMFALGVMTGMLVVSRRMSAVGGSR